MEGVKPGVLSRIDKGQRGQIKQSGWLGYQSGRRCDEWQRVAHGTSRWEVDTSRADLSVAEKGEWYVCSQ